MTYEEFAGREGDVVTGIVQQSERRYTLLDLGKVEALLPQAEQVPWSPIGTASGSRRTSPRSVGHEGSADRRLADASRPAEVAVRARGARDRRGHRRDQGRRSRAGSSLEDRGGLQRARGRPGRGVRRAEGLARAHVVNELRGEKIDVVPWIATTRRRSSRTRCSRRRSRRSPSTRRRQTALVIVPDYQLSLAIGREGQNARLAARLTGWRIDIKSETSVLRRAARLRAGARPRPRSRNRLRRNPGRRRADRRRPRSERPRPSEDAAGSDRWRRWPTGAGAEPTPRGAVGGLSRRSRRRRAEAG